MAYDFHLNDIHLIAQHDGTGRPVPRGRRLVVRQWEQAVVFRHGAHVETLGPGAHRRWQGGLRARLVDLRAWVLLVPTQEVPTADGTTVKVTVAGRARVIDPVAFVTATQDPLGELYLSVQLALRDLLAVTTVEDLAGGRVDLGPRLLGSLRATEGLGVSVVELALKDVILPSELKRAQAEVLVARAQGLAALERARAETAALRGLANAARLAQDNPALLQLKLLQQLAAGGGTHTVVLGTAPVLGSA